MTSEGFVVAGVEVAEAAVDGGFVVCAKPSPANPDTPRANASMAIDVFMFGRPFKLNDSCKFESAVLLATIADHRICRCLCAPAPNLALLNRHP